MNNQPDKSVEKGWSTAGKVWLVCWLAFPFLTVLFLLLSAFFLPRWMRWIGGGCLAFWFFFGLGWLDWYRGQRRSQALQVVTRTLGLTYQAHPSPEDWTFLQIFPLFAKGYDELGENLMGGDFDGQQVFFLDYQFTKDADEFGYKKNIFRQTVIAFPDAQGKAPDFVLLARLPWLAMKLRDLKRGKTGDLHIGKEECPEFYRSCKVKGENEVAIRAFFTPRLMGLLAENPGWDMETVDGNVLIYQEAVLQAPKNLPAVLRKASTILRALQGK